MPTIARQALDRLLAHFPDREVEWIGPPTLRVQGSDSLLIGSFNDPWLCVKFKDHGEILIWKSTGATYEQDDGAVMDDPFLPALHEKKPENAS